MTSRHKEKILKPEEINYHGVFDFKEFFSLAKSFFTRYDYDMNEKNYDDKSSNAIKNIRIKWEMDRKYDDYNRAIITIVYEIKNAKEGYVDGSKVIDGDLKITIEADVERDYDEKWGKSASKRFFMAMYEKLVSGDKQHYVDNLAKDLVKNFKTEIKQYLKI